MANTYRFQLNGADVIVNKDGLENVVEAVHYSYIAEDSSENTASIIGVVQLDSSEITDFIAYDDLKSNNTIVVDWVKAALGEEKIQRMQESLDLQIAEMVAPTRRTLSLTPEVSIEPAPEEPAV
jgi:hypothetical protein